MTIETRAPMRSPTRGIGPRRGSSPMNRRSMDRTVHDVSQMLDSEVADGQAFTRGTLGVNLGR